MSFEAPPAPLEAIPSDDLRRQEKGLRYRLFQNNPIFLFSVAALLYGVFLISDHLNLTNAPGAETWLMLIMETYQFFVLAGAALLFRRVGQYRAAVILGLIQLLLLGDITFQTEQAAVMDSLGLLFSMVWMALLAVKVFILTRIFGFRLSFSAWATLAIGVTTVAILPHLLYQRLLSRSSASGVILVLGFVLVALVVWARPHLHGIGYSRSWEKVLRYVAKATWVSLGVFYTYHAIVWSVANKIPVSSLHVTTVFLLGSLLSRKERSIWIGLFASIAVALVDPPQFSPTLAMATLVFLVNAHRRGHARFYTGAIVAAYLTIQTLGWTSWPFPSGSWLLGVPFVILLLLVAWRKRSIFSLATLVFGAVGWFGVGGGFSGGMSSLGWGIVLASLGFVALGGGVAMSWSVSPRRHQNRS